MVSITLNGIVIADIYSFQIQMEVDVIPHVVFMFDVIVKTLL